MMQKKSAQKVGKKCIFRRLGGRFYEIMLGYVGRPPGNGGVRSSPVAPGKPTYQDGQYLTNETLHRESECRE